MPSLGLFQKRKVGLTFKKINVCYHVIKIKKKNFMVILVDTEKTSD